jgi:uncharacterized repeat protein (TIGR02543 family)
MNKLFVLTIIFALAFTACEQPSNDGNPGNKLPTLTIINSSSYDFTDVQFSGISFSSPDSNGIPRNNQAVRELSEETTKVNYITFKRLPDGIVCRTSRILNTSDEPIFRFDGTTVVDEIGNPNNKGKLLSQIKLQPKITVERNGLNVIKNDIVSLGETIINTPKQFDFILKNTGAGELVLSGNSPVSISGGDGDFSVVQPSGSTIASNNSLILKINCNPGTVQTYNATVTISSDDPNGDFTFFITTEGKLPKPIATILYGGNEIPQNGMIDAGEEYITLSKSITVVIKNTGTEVLTLDMANIAITGAEAAAFTKTTNPGGSVPGGSETSFFIECKPTKQGENNAFLTIPTNDNSRNPVVVYLRVTGVKGSAVLELSQGTTVIANNSLTPVNFGAVRVGNSSSLTFTVKNTGNINLELTGTQAVESSSAAFEITSQPVYKTIAPNSTQDFVIKYTPTTEGQETAEITVMNNTNETLFKLNAKGTGTIPRPSVVIMYRDNEIQQDGTIDMGEVLITQTKNIQIYIKNTGDALLNIDTANIKISGTDSAAFSKITDPVNNISVGSQTSFIIEYTPVKQGDNSATLTIPTNDNFRNPVVIYLQARGRISCAVTFNINNGNGTAPDTQIVPAGSNITLPGENGFSRTWYTFGGWNTSTDGTGANYAVSTSFTPTDDITLYAKWNIISYTITYHINGGNGIAPDAQIVNAGSNITLPNDRDFSRNGYTFTGWNTDPTGTGNNYNDYYLITGDIILYAKWELITSVPGTNLTAKLNWLHSNAVSGVSYTIEVNADESIEPQTLSCSGRENISITLKGIGTERTISLLSNGSMFTVESGITLVLDENISLKGHITNNNRLVRVNSNGILIMNVGSKISGNNGGGVYISDGTFNMYGGEISGNSALTGGGVYVYSGNFSMSGGTISRNTVTSFISLGLSVGGQGGGVYINDRGIFNKTGGTIFGYSSANSNSNVTKNESGVVSSNKGHAVFAHKFVTVGTVRPMLVEDTTKRKETDATQSGNLYFNGTTSPATYSGNWDY